MKVLLTADTVGGVWSHTLELARALHERGLGVVVAAMGGLPTDTQRSDARSVRGLTLHAAPFRLPWMEEPWDDVARAGDWLLELAAASGCDLAHLSEPVFAALPWPVPTVAVGHSCVLSWFEAVRGEDAPVEWDRYRRAMATGLRAAGAVVAPSRAMLGALQRHYGVRGGTVVANGRSPGRFAPGAKQPVVLTAGRLWDPAKNVALLAEVAPHLPWPVYAAGEARSPDGGDAPAAGAVHHLGALGQDAMAEQLARAAVYALPARYEPFGQTVLEAALAGCALVLGDIPSLRELWDGVALFVPPDDAAALRTALESLIRDPSLRGGLAMNARRRALARSPEQMARGYLRVYGRVLAASHRTRSLEAPSCAS
jgi:glycosyltransferase involved in cell wall biosynthesis